MYDEQYCRDLDKQLQLKLYGVYEHSIYYEWESYPRLFYWINKYKMHIMHIPSKESSNIDSGEWLAAMFVSVDGKEKYVPKIDDTIEMAIVHCLIAGLPDKV